MERIICSKTHLPKLPLLSSRHDRRFTGVNQLRCSLFPKQESSTLSLSSSSLFPTASPCSAHDFSDLVNEASSEKRCRSSSKLGHWKDLSRQTFLKVRLISTLYIYFFLAKLWYAALLIIPNCVPCQEKRWHGKLCWIHLRLGLEWLRQISLKVSKVVK
jgi:hypothetical protein